MTYVYIPFCAFHTKKRKSSHALVAFKDYLNPFLAPCPVSWLWLNNEILKQAFCFYSKNLVSSHSILNRNNKFPKAIQLNNITSKHSLVSKLYSLQVLIFWQVYCYKRQSYCKLIIHKFFNKDPSDLYVIKCVRKFFCI